MKIEVWLQRANQPIVFEDAKATYQKGDLFCIEAGVQRYKYPIDHLFMVREETIVSSQPLVKSP